MPDPPSVPDPLREPEPTSEPRLARRERVRRRRRRRNLLSAGTAALAIVVAAAGIGFLTRDSEGSSAPPTTTAAATTTTVPAVEPATIATTAVETLDVRTEPNEAALPIATLEATTDYEFPTTLLVDSETADSTPGWLPVLVPFHKPNATVGWVPEDQVTLSETTYEIEISLADHELVVLDAGEEVFRTTVILGTEETPTPPGRFYVTDPLNCNEEHVPGYPVAKCGSAYGIFAFGVSGLSEALDSFAGTMPQIAVHGTDLPDTELGKDLSNGCIRVSNAAVLEIAATVPLLGVPVTIY